MLPKEIWERIDTTLWSHNVASNISIKGITKHGAEIAQNHYEPIISERDKEIAELKQQVDQYDKEADYWEEQWIMCDAKSQAKDEKIAELQSKYDKVLGLLKRNRIASHIFRYPQDLVERIAMKNKLWDDSASSTTYNNKQFTVKITLQ
jgi:hypothetical protein